MSKKRKNYGWSAALNDYSIKSILMDGVLPLIISFFSIVLLFLAKIDIHKALSSLLDLSLNVIPIMLSLLLAGYTILLSLYWSDFGEKTKKIKGGSNLINQINASFAISILIMILGVFIIVVTSFLYNLDLKSPDFINSNIINGSICFIILFLLTYSIWIMKDITINIYNLGKASMNIE